MNWQPIGECPIPNCGEAPQRMLVCGTDAEGNFAWGEGCMLWNGTVHQLFFRAIVVTHFCIVTPPEAKP